ncbi:MULTISPECIES: hypothetical protein [Sphingobacterium]|uniref:hypothetical protein n=1 Tax=Sphingobacterium TaxID=28453 RepID=UPI002580C192|nr:MULTISPECIES: hypothetical protein [Sphingobacterium]
MRGTALGACVALVDLPLRMAGALAGLVAGPLVISRFIYWGNQLSARYPYIDLRHEISSEQFTVCCSKESH